MRYHYDSASKILCLNGDGTLILTKNGYGIHVNDGLYNNPDFKTIIEGYTVFGNCSMGFKSKIKGSLVALKYIWTKA